MKLSERYQIVEGLGLPDDSGFPIDDITEEVFNIEAKKDALREFATHKPGCYESGEDCICGLDALLAGEEMRDE